MDQKEKTRTNSGKKLQGIVIGVSDATTIKVNVETKQPHPLYGKIIKSHKKYLVHNDIATHGIKDIAVGDLVQIQECRPLSKRKHFTLVQKIEKK